MLADQPGRTLPSDVAEPPADRAMLALQYLIAAAAGAAALLLASLH
jgi:hypothetical protein